MLNIEKYLSRTWYNAKIPYHYHDDCSQTVLLNLLSELGRNKFDTFLQESYIKDDPNIKIFLRIITMVRKRFQRIKSFCSIDDVDESVFSELDNNIFYSDFYEYVTFGFKSYEIDLINKTLANKTLFEIATECNISLKTVSNRKTCIFNKIRTKNVLS